MSELMNIQKKSLLQIIRLVSSFFLFHYEFFRSTLTSKMILKTSSILLLGLVAKGELTNPLSLIQFLIIIHLTFSYLKWLHQQP